MTTQTFVIQVQMKGGQQAAAQLNQIGVSAQKAAKDVSVVSKTMALFRNALVAASIGRVISSVVEFADTVVNMDNRLRVATKSAEEFARAQQFISELSRSTRTEIDSNAVVYSRLLRSTEGLGFETKELETAMEGLALSVKVGGATSQEARNSLIQFSQSLASGALRGDELRSVAEQLPALASAIGKEFGMAGGQLIAFAKANPGILETEKVMRGVINAVPALREQFATMQVSIGDGFILLRNGFLEYLRTLNSSTGVFSVIGNALGFLGNNIQVVADAALYLAFVMGTKLAVEAMGSLIAMMGKLALAAIANPWTALAYAIVALTGFIITFRDTFQPVGDLFDWARDKLIAFAEAIDFTGGMITNFVKRLFGLTKETGTFYAGATQATKSMAAMGDEAAKTSDDVDKLKTGINRTIPVVTAYGGAMQQAGLATAAVGDWAYDGAGVLTQLQKSYSGAASAARDYTSAAYGAASVPPPGGGGGGGGGGSGRGSSAGGTYTSKIGLSRDELAASEAAVRQATQAAVELKTSESAYKYLAERRDLPGDVRNKAFTAAQQYAKDIAMGLGENSVAALQLRYLGLENVAQLVKRTAQKVLDDQKYNRGSSFATNPTLNTSSLVGAFLRNVGNYGALEFMGGGGFSGSPGFRTGGSFMVGGNGGPDSQQVSFRATPGEMVQISKRDPAKDSKPTTINITAQVIVPDVRDPNSFARSRAQIENTATIALRRAAARV